MEQRGAMSSAERMQALRERQKANRPPETKLAKSSLERSREYRARKRALQRANQPPKPLAKSALERSREYRARRKALLEQSGGQRYRPFLTSLIHVPSLSNANTAQLENSEEEDGRSLPKILASYSLHTKGGESQALTQLGSPTGGEIQLATSGIKIEDQASSISSKEWLSSESSMEDAMSSDQGSLKGFRKMSEEDDDAQDEQRTAENGIVGAEDRFARSGQVWGSKLRELPLVQALEAERLINDILSVAQEGNLSSKCTLLLPPKLPSKGTGPLLPALFKFKFRGDKQQKTVAESADRLTEIQASPDQISLPDSLLQIKLEIEDAPIAADDTPPLDHPQQNQVDVMSDEEKLAELPISTQLEEPSSLEPKSSSHSSSGIYMDEEGTWTKIVNSSCRDEKDSARTLENVEVIAKKWAPLIKAWVDKFRALPADQVFEASRLINSVLNVARRGNLNHKCYLIVPVSIGNS